MQTFTPYSDFEASLRALDVRRLGKQRVEVIQIVRALTVPGYAWSSHPAVLMWQGYEEALGRYGLIACDIWIDQGFADSCAATITEDLRRAGVSGIRPYAELAAAGALPGWLFDDALLLSHRSALVRKDPDHYRPLFGDEVPPDLPYLWPVRSPAVIERERAREENARRRAQRAAERLVADQERARRRRSQAAKRGWRTRAANRVADGAADGSQGEG